MSRRTHQIFFAAIIFFLILIPVFVPLNTVQFILLSMSLLMMLILPLGKKGGSFHIAAGTFGLILFIALLLVYN